ncbi:MAG: flavin monoamine oxidase family protein [Gammaproteobacteria bacterium]|nr:flavin monoamine oxidase family protein [Gammaproteobacteria bacterium]
MSNHPGHFSRRTFLSWVGAAGGSSAVYQTSVALGLIPGVGVAAPMASLTALGPKRRKVAILGAGISGLACAYELERAGYDCTVIEASHRIGGRNLTVRRGDLIDEMGNKQICEFDDHPNLYFNAGPARIPAHHNLVLHYCKTLGVALEVFVNENRHAWVHDSEAFGGTPVRLREYVADARGFMTELMAKAISYEDFEAPFSAEDAERFFLFLRRYGDLDENDLYHGSARAGYESGGMVAPPVHKQPYDFREILKHDFWRSGMHWTAGEDQAEPMMQAVGGNDNVVRGFVRNIESPILLNAPVQSIRLRDDGVEVVYAHEGKNRKLDADYCLNSIPRQLIPGIHNNFPADYLQGMAAVGRGKLMKIGIQMSERFWEAENIYGGISWTDQPIEQIWYPTHGIHDKKGVMLGAYVFSSATCSEYARLSPAERLAAAIAQGEKIHPRYADYVDSGVSVPWHRMNHMMGCTAVWSKETRDRWYARLQAPEGRHYLMGDQISYHPGWQEGALSSAHYALADLDKRVQTELRGESVNA